jgi:dolichol kinase
MLVHASSLLVPVLAETISKGIVIAALAGVTAVYIVSESVRIKGGKIPLITSFTLRMSHQGEGTPFIAEPAYLAAGIMLALTVFPKGIAYASISIVAVGDPIAAYVGRRIGRLHIGKRTLEGFVAGLIGSLLVASHFVVPPVGAVGSTIAMLLELSGILEDNLTMPLGAGVAMILASKILQTF